MQMCASFLGTLMGIGKMPRIGRRMGVLAGVLLAIAAMAAPARADVTCTTNNPDIGGWVLYVAANEPTLPLPECEALRQYSNIGVLSTPTPILSPSVPGVFFGMAIFFLTGVLQKGLR